MIMIQKSVDRKWVDQGRVDTKEKAIAHVKAHGINQVNEFKTCDCLRAIDEETGEIIISHPSDFVERD